MGPSGRIGHILYILDCLGQVYADLYLGRAPRTKETLPDFLKWRRVTRPPLVFRGLTGSVFFVRAPPPDPLRRGVVPLTGYRGMSHALFFRLRESSNPRPNGHIEMGSTLTTNWATSSVGSESAPHFNMSLWSWVRALTEAKEKGMGHAPIACEWDHPSSEWASGWGPYSFYPFCEIIGGN